MDYRGIIIEESLANKSVLDDVTIVKTVVEAVTEDHKTPWLKQWTVHTVEVPEEKAEEIINKISKALDVGWYADYKNDNHHYIIFGNKIFKVDRKKPSLYKEVKEYGVSVGIPDYQLDFASDDKMWGRK